MRVMSAGPGAATLLVALVAPLLLLAPMDAANPPGRTEGVLDYLALSLDLEKRGAAEDAEEFDRLSGRVSRAEGDLTQAVSRLVRLLKDGNAERTALENAEDAVDEAEVRVRGEQEKRRALSVRMADRVRRMIVLRDEIGRRRQLPSADPVTGRWDVSINPGGRRGVYRLTLDGTLVWGDYVLDGNFRGSFRGTLVGDKLTLQRIDSEGGFDATFYGRVLAGQKRIVGTWEGTQIAPTIGPTAGTWSAVPSREPEEGERP